MRALLLLALFPSLVLAQGVTVKAGSASNLVDVNANLQMRVTTSQDGGTLGETQIIGGSGNSVYVTEGNRLAVSQVWPLWDDTFNATAQNTAKYRAPIATMTVTFTGGYANINGGSIVTANTNAALQTYRTFALYAKSELQVNMSVMRTQAPQANCVEEMGLFTATLPGAAAPTDGCFFRWNAAAELRGVCSYNGTETQTAVITSPSINVNHDYLIAIQTNTVQFTIDDVLVGTINLLVDAPTEGQPMSQAAVPFTIRQYIGATPPSLANQLRISDVFVNSIGQGPNRSWEDAKAGYGHSATQGQNGGTMGTTANYANSANPTAAVPTNTTAALGTGLGGQFWETFSLALTTDGIISSYQNPTGSVTQTPRNLICTGVGISSYVQTVLAGGPSCAQWSIAYGHTNVSLATAEAATAKAPRRIPLAYTQCVTAAQAVNTKVGTDFYQKFSQPIIVQPGEFIATVTKHVGTVGTSGTIAHVIWFDCRNE
jgi:hypothetical protein